MRTTSSSIFFWGVPRLAPAPDLSARRSAHPGREMHPRDLVLRFPSPNPIPQPPEAARSPLWEALTDQVDLQHDQENPGYLKRPALERSSTKRRDSCPPAHGRQDIAQAMIAPRTAQVATPTRPDR
jgi:hypothetical protein